MNRDPEQNAPAVADTSDATQSANLDAFLFKDNLWDLIQALMDEGDWQLPEGVDEKQFVENVFHEMRDGKSTWVKRAAKYFLDNSEYFLSNQEALEIFDEELETRGKDVADSVRHAFLEFLYRDFPNFCSQAIRNALDEASVQKL
ncbi:MAG: hypothetical protein O3A46_09735 [Candidatus Poribacteria bacterium]|nr:hypothetical protein [Candidatus Poribacteria bacterium]